MSVVLLVVFEFHVVPKLIVKKHLTYDKNPFIDFWHSATVQQSGAESTPITTWTSTLAAQHDHAAAHTHTH